APCWRHCPTCSRFRVPIHSKKRMEALLEPVPKSEGRNGPPLTHSFSIFVLRISFVIRHSAAYTKSGSGSQCTRKNERAGIITDRDTFLGRIMAAPAGQRHHNLPIYGREHGRRPILTL